MRRWATGGRPANDAGPLERAAQPCVASALAELGADAVPRQERPGLLMPALALLQRRHGSIADGTIAALARSLGLPESKAYAAATFYSSFSLAGDACKARPPALDAALESVMGAERAPDAIWSRGIAAPDGRPDGALVRCGHIRPASVDDYRAAGGYAGLRAALAMPAEAVIEAIRSARLRGRGGAGFPTAAKWDHSHTVVAPAKVVICNAAEGDPGAFADLAILQQDPHSVLEGMAIAAHAVGAATGIVYIRSEYEEAIATVRGAVREASESGVLGSGFTVEVFSGGGRYVCGDETALLNSMEGAAGRPRLRPPLPTEHGLWGRPTVVDNVKTLALVPLIMRHGPEWFASIGTAATTGPAILAVSGFVRRPGVVEVPMGATLRQAIEEGCGGMADGARLKAMQTGGPLGAFLPADALDTPICFDAMKAAGSPLGSGGIIVVDHRTCMVASSRAFAEFAAAESCGHCAPCRLGTQQVVLALRNLMGPGACAADLDLIHRMEAAMRSSSFCAYGRSAASVVVSAVRVFPEEFDAHAADRRCPADWCSMEAL